MIRTTSARLLDAYNAAVEIETMVGDLSFNQYLADRKTQLSVQFLFMIIGEALSKVSKSDPNAIASITDVTDIIGMRNRIVHGYDQVDHVTVWSTAVEELPEFRAELREIITEAGAWPV